MEERRQHPRFAIDVTVDVVGGADPLAGTMRDISLGGAFLRLAGRLPQGSRVDVHVGTDALPALVCRVALNGVGVAWDSPSDDQLRVIEALVIQAAG